MSNNIRDTFLAVKDIGEWQKLCSYKFGDQEDYKLDWWVDFIESKCVSNNLITIDILTLINFAKNEFSQWPIEILCLPAVFKGLISKQKITSVKHVCNHIKNAWDNSLEVEGDKFKEKNSRIKFGWFHFLFGSYNSEIKSYFSNELNYKFSNSDIFLCIGSVKKVISKITYEIEQGTLGKINKSLGSDELVTMKDNFNDYITKNFSDIKDITDNILSDIIIWYFMLFSPGGWKVRPFVIVNMNSKIYVYKFKKYNSISNNKNEIEIMESDVVDVIMRVTEIELRRSISNLEEKYLFHDLKCREYALNDQKQLAINHIKQKRQIESALAEINEQLLLISQSKVEIDTSNARISLLSALESSSSISKKILNDSEIIRKLDNISQTREEVEFTQSSINSLLKSCADNGVHEEGMSEELEKELEHILTKMKLRNIDNGEAKTGNKVTSTTNRKEFVEPSPNPV